MAQFNFWVPQKVSTSQKSQTHTPQSIQKGSSFEREKTRLHPQSAGCHSASVVVPGCEGGGLLQHLERQWEVSLASQSYLGPFLPIVPGNSVPHLSVDITSLCDG